MLSLAQNMATWGSANRPMETSVGTFQRQTRERDLMTYSTHIDPLSTCSNKYKTEPIKFYYLRKKEKPWQNYRGIRVLDVKSDEVSYINVDRAGQRKRDN